MFSHATRQWTSVCFLLFLSTTAFAAEVRRAPERVPNHYIVGLRDATKPADIDRLAKALCEKYDGELLAVWKSVAQGFWVRMTPKDAARLANDKRVASVSEDAVMHDSGSQVTGPNSYPGPPVDDPNKIPYGADPLWHLTRINHRTPTAAGAGLPTTTDYFRYDYQSDGTGVTVYVVDGGMVNTHQEFTAKAGPPAVPARDVQEVPGANLVATPNLPRTDVLVEPVTEDFSPSTLTCDNERQNAGHGTACASLVVGINVGVAKGVTLVPVKLASCVASPRPASSTALFITAFEWLFHNAHRPAVVTISTYRIVDASYADDHMRAICSDTPVTCMTGADAEVFERAVVALVDAGIPVVAAANNQADDACRTTPARLSRRGGRGFRIGNVWHPARVITVGGTKPDDHRYANSGVEPGSNYGQCVDIWAPAQQITVADPVTGNNHYRTVQFSGTSFSAPIVAGAIARFMSEDPALDQTDKPGETADNVWARLEETATRLPAASDLGNASPNLLLYAGPLTILKPIVTVTGPATVAVEAKVKATGNLLYQWYRGEPGHVTTSTVVGTTTAATADFPVTGGVAGSYWVRVSARDGNNNPLLPYSDSAATIVKDPAAECPSIVVTTPIVEMEKAGEPNTFIRSSGWFTSSDLGKQARITVTAKGATRYCYRWESVPASLETLPSGTIDVLTPTTDATFTLPRTVTSDRSRLYKLVIYSANSADCTKAGCSVESDSVQIRVCSPPKIDQPLPNPYPMDLMNSSQPLAVVASGTSLQYTWYRGLADPQPVIIGSDNDAHLVHDSKLSAPPATDWYSVKVSNDCSEALSSTAAYVRLCDYGFKNVLVDGVGGHVLRTTELADADMTVTSTATPALEVTLQGPQGAPNHRNHVTFAWYVNGVLLTDATGATISGNRAVIPASNSPRRVVKVAAYDPETYCRREGYFVMACPTCVVACETYEQIRIIASQCGNPNNQPTYKARLNGHVLIQPIVTNLGGIRISPEDLKRYKSRWTIKELNNGQLVDTVIADDDTWSLKYKVTKNEDITIAALCNGVVKAQMVLHVEAQEPACPAGEECLFTCRPRPLRVRGDEAEVAFINDGESITLQVPEEGVGYTYDWHRDSDTSGDETFDHGAAVTVTPHRNTSYWVITNSPNGPEYSLRFVVVVNETVSRELTITPEFQTITANGVAWIHSDFPRKDLTTKYEWRRGPQYDTTQPVIADSEILALANLPDDATFWLRVKHGTSNPQEEHWSKMATVVVTCTPTINGTVSVLPFGGRLTRAETPSLEVWGYGKNLVYSWYRDDMLAAYGPALHPTLAARATKFNARLEDQCGSSVTLPPTWLYRCIPIIDQQPQKNVIKTGQTATLTIAATPAIDGEQLKYEWYHASDPSMQEQHPPTGASLNVASADAGDYFAAVISSCATTDDYKLKSAVATVEVCADPVIDSYTPAVTITAAGQSAPISVSASGKELTYQWYRGESTLLAGETGAQLLVSPPVTTTYWCRITSQGVCTTDSPTITVNVCRSPVFSVQPGSTKIFSAGTATLTAAASETLGNAVTLQWYESSDGQQFAPIANATGTSYTTLPLSAPRFYQVKATAGAGGMCSSWSEVATVAICTYGELLGGPSDREIAKGDSTMLQLIVSPAYDKFITWYRGESGDSSDPVAGGYLNAVANVSPAVTTKYWARVEYDGCTSRTTTTTVYVSIPTITTQPAGGIVAANNPLTLTVATNGTAGETFQWFTGTPNGTNALITGATATSYVAQPAATMSYFVRITGSRGFVVTSNVATVTVCAPPSISATSGPHFIRSGQQAQLSVTASGTNLTYQWYAGASPNTTAPVTGGNGVYATVTPAATSTYWVRVNSDGVCKTDSANVSVDVCTDPTIGTQPASQMITSGGNAAMSVTATATTGAMTYQWYRGVAGNTSQPISGATGSSYTAIALTADAQFWVRVTRGACWKDSNTATITVCNLSASVSGTQRTTSGQQATITATVYYARAANPTITFYRGAAGDMSTPLQSSTNTQLTVYPTATTTYWARVNDGTCTANTSAHTVDVCLPAISAHPQGGVVSAGGAFNLSVTAGGTSPITYQWYRGNTGDVSQPIGGAVNATVTVNPNATTSYWVRVNGSCNQPADSNAATVTVCAPPSVGSTSGPHYIRSGQPAQMSVTATGTSLTYQWYSGTVGNTASPVSGGTSAVTTVSPASTTTYWAQVKSYGVCGANSGSVLVDVCTDPDITANPTSRQIRLNETTTLSVTASATTGPVSYQWYRGASGDTSQLINGATASSYTTPALTSDTSYWARVSRGPACSRNSTAATVTVCSISASISGTSQTTSGQAATLAASVYYSRIPSPTITWYRGATGDTSNVLQSSTSTQLTVYPTSTTSYWARVTDGTCPIDTAAFAVNVCIPTISAHPVGTTVAANTNVTLTVTAGGTSPLTYQWFKGTVGDTSQPVGTNSSSVTVSTPSTANYWCRVSGSCGISVNSNAATITICTPPSFFANSGPHMIQSGTPVMISSSFNGTDVTYQWYQGTSGSGSAIGGVTTSPYLTVSPTSTTSYWMQARSGGACPANSPTINIDVCTTPSISSQPASATVATNSTYTMSVTASASPGTITYQWYIGASGNTSQLISGATASSYTTPPMTTQTQYWVRVTRGACSIDSATATIGVCVPPYVWLNVYDWGDCWGFEVTPVAGGYGSWRYHWYKGPAGNVGASVDYGESGLSRNNVCPTATETWWVRVSNYDNPNCYKDISGTIYPR